MNTTKLSRNMRNELSAESYFDLTNGKKLRISTWKGSRGYLVTNAQAVRIEKGIESFMMFQDFSKTAAQHLEAKRATEKTIREAHEIALKNIDTIIEEANKFYEGKNI